MYHENYTKLRDARKLNDYRVSKETGISLVCLTEWKQGRYTPKMDKFIKLADYFGVPIEELVR